MSEHTEQAALFEWAERRLAALPELRWMFAIPNGGWRPGGSGGRLKAEGVREGVPDICLPVARGGHHALYIEMKIKGGAVRPKQQNWITALHKEGNRVEVCWSTIEAARTLEDYLGVPAAERTQWMESK